MKWGLSVEELAVIDFAQMNAIIGGKLERAEAQNLDMWRMARYMAYVQVMCVPGLKPQQKPKRPEDLFALKGDTEKKIRSIRYLRARHNKILKAWGFSET